MRPEVEAAYQAAMRTIVLKHGALTDPGNHAYGWIADDWQHKHQCTLTSTQNPLEAEWSEFGGSFTDHHPVKHGVDLPGVSCACGQVKDRTVRWDANPYEMARLIFEEVLSAHTHT